MQEKSFTWGSLRKQYRELEARVDWIWVLLLLVLSVLIFTINLGHLPLRDWDEGTVAQVARDIWRAPAGSMRWLYPTLAGEAYHNKPPLVHWLIAGAYALGGENEWMTRLPGAVLTATSVPLLYCIGRELFRHRAAAVYSALIYLTMLPVVRHGRLAMLDGVALCFFILMMLFLLKARRDLRYCLGVGIAFGLICLTKGILAILLGAVACVFIFWDTPRLLRSGYMWLGVIIGCAPVIAWYGAQWHHYGLVFAQQGLLNQSLNRIWSNVEGHKQPFWYYPLEILKYTWPYFIFLPHSIRFTWENKNLSWAKLVLLWSIFYLVSISLMGTKLPWYVYPIYPSFALAIGAQLSEIQDMPVGSSYPRIWVFALAFISIITSIACIYFGWGIARETDLQFVFGALALTMALSCLLADRGDKQFLQVLLWGCYISLILLMASNNWIWELAERYPVKPVAEIIKTANIPANKKIYIYFPKYPPEHRPSLDFYSERPINSINFEQLKSNWNSQIQSYFVLEKSEIEKIPGAKSKKIIKETKDWAVITNSRVVR
jgi:4-amino-4-deoxy-L-arabinose transferase-like glycosyltransferase